MYLEEKIDLFTVEYNKGNVSLQFEVQTGFLVTSYKRLIFSKLKSY